MDSQHFSIISGVEQVRQRFDEICNILQLPEHFRPRLKIMEIDSRRNWHVFGRYSRKTNILQLSTELLQNDYIAVHELIHFVCAKELRYHGSHGVPFLALHDLVIAYYLDREALGDGVVIDTQWASIATRSTKKKAGEESAAIVEEALANLADAGYSRESPPGIMMLAKIVKNSSARKYCFAWQDWKTWLRGSDFAWTQRHGIFPMLSTLIARGVLASVVICGVLAKLFGEVHWEWLRGATFFFGALAVGLLFLFPVYQYGVKVFVGYDLRKAEDGS